MSEAAGMDADERVAIPELLLGALGFYRAPQRFAQLRDPAQPLPAGVTELLAAGAQSLAPEQIAATAARLGSNPQELQDAVLFFIRQAMLEAGGDHYRTLGVARDADTALIRQHYHYLIRLFHPDRDVENEAWDAPYATAVNEAWNVLRNPQKRAAYDADLAAAREHVLARTDAPVAAPRAAPRAPVRTPRAGSARAGHWRAAGRLGLAVLACLAIALVWLAQRQPANTALRVTVPAVRAAGNAAGGVAAAPGQELAAQRPAGNEAAAPSGAQTTRPGSRAAALPDGSIEERVRASVKQATLAVLGPERARAAPRAAREAAPPRAATEDATEPVASPAPAEPVADAPERVVLAAPGEPAAGRADAAVPAPAPAPVSVPASAPVQQEPAPAAEALPALTAADLDAVLRELAASYEAGDALRFAALFAEQARTTDATGRDAIEALYRDFFARPESRRMHIGNMRWRADGAHNSRGAGKAELVTAHFDGGAEARGVLTLRVEVEQTPRGPRITGLHYE